MTRGCPGTSRGHPSAPGASTVRYGDTLAPDQLRAGPLPTPRGPLTGWLFDHLRQPPHRLPVAPRATDHPLDGEDSALALYCLYELHYRGFRDVDDGWEWEPSLLGVRAGIERSFERRLRAEVGPAPATRLPQALHDVVASGSGPSLSRWLAERGTLEQFREFAVHRSAYQLKEADPHTWTLPRLAGEPKAAMVEIQADEYGAGRERDMHQNLFAVTMAELDLDPSYGAYLDRLPAPTLAAVNLASFFGLHRRLRGACVGHLAVFEMTSVEPMGRYAAALRRLGLGPDARHFYEVHVVADAHHQSVAAEALAAGLARQEPTLAADIVFGAQAVMVVEQRWAAAVHEAWAAGRSSLRPAPATSGAA